MGSLLPTSLATVARAVARAVAGVALGVLLVSSGPALADDYPVGDRLLPGAPALQNPHFDCVVATVLLTEDAGTTNADPPTSRVRIERVLRGNGQPRVLRLAWRAQPGPDAYSTPAQFRDGEYVAPVVRDRWYERPLRGPDRGERLILFYADAEVDGSVDVQFAYRGTPGNVRTAEENLAPPERTGWVQVPLFVAIVLSPVLCAAFFVLPLARRFPEGLRRRCSVVGVAVVPPLALVLYLFYESGISPLTNIRIDLLLVLPALFVAFLFWPALLVRLLFERRR